MTTKKTEIYEVHVRSNGSKLWYQNGERHRTDGPAIEYADGTKCWWLNDKLHRTDGPALEYADGSKYWYLNGKRLSESEFLKQTQPSPCEGKIVEIDGKKYRLSEI